MTIALSIYGLVPRNFLLFNTQEYSILIGQTITKFYMKREMNQLDNRLPNSGGMCGSPSLAYLGQHWPPAVAQQCPHVPCLLPSGGQSTPTECIVCMWVSEWGWEKRGAK